MRKAKLISLEEFKQKIEEKLLVHKKTHSYYKPPYTISKKVEKDLQKVNFDWENYEIGIDSYNEPNLGIKLLGNNLPVLFCYAGGDWEYPVHFIIYWSGTELRGYIPEEGNVYNKADKKAWDGDETEDKEDFKKMEEDIINRIQIIP